jgi:polysaccharide chain length determinant protein (PEP-CTERM system associated)
MGQQFRPRSVDEYLGILRKRFWVLFLPFVIVAAATLWTVLSLPTYYESNTFLTITPPQISEKVAPSLTDDDLSLRLRSINQTLLSRTFLESIVNTYDLFRNERELGVPVEALVEKLKSRITIELKESDERKVLGLRITYRGTTPELAKAIADELAARVISSQRQASAESVEMTRQFIETQLANARQRLDEIEKQRLEIMSKNVASLPDSSQGLIAQLSGYRQSEQTISRDREITENELTRVRDNIRSLNEQIRMLENYGEADARDAITQASRIEDTPAYAQLVQKRAELNAKLEVLRKQYKDKHPEIIQVQIDIDKVNDELTALTKNAETRRNQAIQASVRKAEAQKQNLRIELEKAQNQEAQLISRLKEKEDALKENAARAAEVEARINEIPGVKVTLEEIDQDYQSAKAVYDDLVKKYSNAKQLVDVENNRQGETIRVVDPANLPQYPVSATKKPMLAAMGAGIGLLLGLGLCGVLEAPTFFKIKNIADAEFYSGIPVIGTIPVIYTQDEISRMQRMRIFKIVAAVTMVLFATPALALILERTHVFERFY